MNLTPGDTAQADQQAAAHADMMASYGKGIDSFIATKKAMGVIYDEARTADLLLANQLYALSKLEGNEWYLPFLLAAAINRLVK